jgi:hypothetical protein
MTDTGCMPLAVEVAGQSELAVLKVVCPGHDGVPSRGRAATELEHAGGLAAPLGHARTLRCEAS